MVSLFADGVKVDSVDRHQIVDTDRHQTDKPDIDWMITTCGVQEELSWLAPKL